MLILLALLLLPHYVPPPLWDLFSVEVDNAGARPIQPMLAAQIDTESAWRPEARSRYAAGLAQFTPPTWRDIAPRTSPSCAGRPETDPGCSVRAQIVYMRALLGSRTCRSFPDASHRWACAWAAYNGGLGWVMWEQAACREAANCDPGRWYGHVAAMRHGVRRGALTRRAAAAWRENRAYPVKIERTIPRYEP